MKIRLIVALVTVAAPVLLSGQSPDRGGLDPATIRKPLSDSWPMYSGDYTGRRFSALTQVNQTTVKGLTLAWVARLTAGSGAGPDPRAAEGPGAAGAGPAG